jgi:hypothetical protein
MIDNDMTTFTSTNRTRKNLHWMKYSFKYITEIKQKFILLLLLFKVTIYKNVDMHFHQFEWIFYTLQVDSFI